MLGDRLASLRKEKELSQEDLGLRAGNLGYLIAEMKASGFSFDLHLILYVFKFFK